MKITDVPFAVLRFQYRVVRFPLQLIEDRVVARMGAEFPVRLVYERSLGVLDAKVGNALGDRQREERGAALAERSDALDRAARLDAAATQKKEHADDELKAKRDKAIVDQQKAHATKEHEVAETRRTAEQRKRTAEADAESRTAAAKNQADQVAARHLKTAEDAHRDEQAKIRCGRA